MARLNVIIDDEEYRQLKLRLLSRRPSMSITEWVRKKVREILNGR